MNFTEARFKKKLTQWDIQRLTGISQSKISLIERGYVSPSEDEKDRIASALGFGAREIEWPGPGQS